MKNKMYKQRREQILAQIPEGVILIPSGQMQVRSNDTEFPFRQESNFYYLSGFNEPDALLVLCKQGKATKSVLFLRPRDETMEMWTGERLGAERAVNTLGVDEAYSIDSLEEHLKPLLIDQSTLYLDTFSVNTYLLKVKALSESLLHDRSVEVTPRHFKHVNALLERNRLIKEPYEIEQIRRALGITTHAHHAAMARVEPGMREYEIQALIEYIFKKEGSGHDAYESIVAGGNRANTLHYVENSQLLQSGELMLIDAGCEWDYYASDITRTSPVNGKFTAGQQALYEGILEAQLKVIDAIKPGMTKQKLQEKSQILLSQVLKDLGVLTESIDTILEQKLFKKYYPHGIGHWMGLDVHDTCPYKDEEGKDVVFEEGMVLTIEPALYIGQEDSGVPDKYRGIGIRTEDDILVTKNGYENLSSGIAKTVDEIEAMCKRDYREFL